MGCRCCNEEKRIVDERERLKGSTATAASGAERDSQSQIRTPFNIVQSQTLMEFMLQVCE